MDDNIYKLKKLGLADKEVRVYLTALEFGPAGVAELAKKSGVKRTTIHEFIDDLVERGYIEESFFGKRKVYLGADPKKLEEIVLKQKEIAASLVQPLGMLISKNVKRPRISYYEGLEGVKKVFADRLKQDPGSEILMFTRFTASSDMLSHSFLDEYSKKRVNRKIVQRSIVPDTPRARQVEKRGTPLREFVFVPENEVALDSEVSVYNNKISIISYDEKAAILIESISMANALRSLFNLVWRAYKK